MKSIINIVLVSVLGMALGFTACTDDYKYNSAEVPDNAQVYFPNTLPQRLNLSPDFTVRSYDIELRRIDKAGALTVNLTVVNENPDLFTNIPTSVSFAAGSDVTIIKLDYDSEKLGYDNFKPLRISISDESLTSPYGAAVYAFNAGIPAPWKSLGKAKFSCTDFFWMEDVEVELQQHELFPTRYRLVDPFAKRGVYYSNVLPNDSEDPYFAFQILSAGGSCTTFNREDGTITVSATVDGLVVFEPANIGMTYNEGPEMAIWHPAARTPTSAGEENWLKNIVTRWSEDGNPEIVQIAPWFVQLPTGAGWNYSDDDGIITIVFPGVVFIDYSMSSNYLGHYVDADDVDNAVVQFTMGEDAANYKYVVLEGALDAGDAKEVVAEIIAGTIATEEGTESGYKIFPLDAGTYTVVAVTFDEDGEAQDFDYVPFKFIPTTTGIQWVSLGFCEYTDDLFITQYAPPSYIETYDVKIFEHRDTPGLFRLKNAYGADYPYNDPGDYDLGNVYIEINATDPDGVYIDFQSMGVDWGDGTAYIYSLASYMMDEGDTFEEVKEAGVCGTYEDGVITFPVETLFVVFEGDDELYEGNESGLWEVDMTSLLSISSKSALSSKSVSSKSSLSRSSGKVKSPSGLKKKSFRPVRVKGQNVPASVIRNNMSITEPIF